MIGPPYAPAPLTTQNALADTNEIQSSKTTCNPQSVSMMMWIYWTSAFSGGGILTTATSAETGAGHGYCGIELNDTPPSGPTCWDVHSDQNETNFLNMTPALNTWYFVGFTGGPSVATAYIRPLGGTFIIGVGGNTVAGSSTTTLTHPDINFNAAIITGMIAGFKTFNRALNANEMFQESLQLAPVNQSAYISNLKFIVGGNGALYDSAIPGRKWTETSGPFLSGTLAPPVPLYTAAQSNIGVTPAMASTLNAPYFGMEC